MVGESVGGIEGNDVLGAPVWVEPLTNVGYAVDGARVGETEGVAVGATVGTSVGDGVGKMVGTIEGNAVLGAPVFLEAVVSVGYAVDGLRVGKPEGVGVAILGP